MAGTLIVPPFAVGLLLQSGVLIQKIFNIARAGNVVSIGLVDHAS